eukprot:3822529-Rhodomonas_salina.1
MSQGTFQLGSAHLSNTQHVTTSESNPRQRGNHSPSIHDGRRNNSTHACVRLPADITPRPYLFTRGNSRLRPTKIGTPPLHPLSSCSTPKNAVHLNPSPSPSRGITIDR